MDNCPQCVREKERQKDGERRRKTERDEESRRETERDGERQRERARRGVVVVVGQLTACHRVLNRQVSLAIPAE